jgi:hypothetical protein
MLVAELTIFLQRFVDQKFRWLRNLRIELRYRVAFWCKIAPQISPELDPSNGILPVAISYNTAPKENRSVRASSSFARTCSGDI